MPPIEAAVTTGYPRICCTVGWISRVITGAFGRPPHRASGGVSAVKCKDDRRCVQPAIGLRLRARRIKVPVKYGLWREAGGRGPR